ncbi:helix-turn-helix transcriptional regulator [Mycobacterium sp. CSUR Q5927]|nr:helix-turn-helix transcriptional regulator [Mycobacterium sp. CSUR Q5927]
MARRGYTQESLSRRVGMLQQSLSRRLTGQTAITVDDLDRIARALGVELAALLPSSTVTARA